MITEGRNCRSRARIARLLPPLLVFGLSLFALATRIYAQSASNAGSVGAPTAAANATSANPPNTAAPTAPRGAQVQPPPQESLAPPPQTLPQEAKQQNPLSWTSLENPIGVVRYDWDGNRVVGNPNDPNRDGFSVDSQDRDSSRQKPSERKSLKFFAYDFFEPARQIIMARRMRLLGLSNPLPSGYDAYGMHGENGWPTPAQPNGPVPPARNGERFDKGVPPTTPYQGSQGNTDQGNGYPGDTNGEDNGNEDNANTYGQPGYGQDNTYGQPGDGQDNTYGQPGYGQGNFNPYLSQQQNPPGYEEPETAASHAGPNQAPSSPAAYGSALSTYQADGSDSGALDGAAMAGIAANSPYGPAAGSGAQDGQPYGPGMGAPFEGQQTQRYSANYGSNYGDGNYSPQSGYGFNGGQNGQGFPQTDQRQWPANGQYNGPYDDRYPTPGQFSGTNQDMGDTGPIDAYQSVADPLSELTHNVIASAPSNYELEAGDQVTVRYWSPTRPVREFTQTIGPTGTIVLEGGRQVVLRGLTTDQADRVLSRELGHLYRDVEVAVSLKELRTIQVTVSGDAFAPGTYTVPAVSTAFNVLYAAGGPTNSGSLRQIEVRRHGRLAGHLDVYKFIMVGAEAHDIRLQPGDLIYIPPRISQVTIDGEVRDPAIYELLDTETLRDALHYAGGVKPSGVDQHIQVSTLLPGQERILKDINLQDAKNAALPLYDGDTVHVFSVRNTLANKVTIEGSIDQPGDYAFTAGMKVSNLLEEARGALSQAFLGRADLYRWNPDNTTTLVPIDLDKAVAGDPTADIPLQRWDRLRVYSQQEVAWTGHHEVTVRGAVQRPGIYYCSKDMDVRDLLLMAGGPAPDAYLKRAVLLHQNGDGTYAYDFVHISEALNGDPAEDYPVHDNDILALYRVGEAQYTPDHLVSVQGAVVSPGLYPRGDGMHLTDLLKIAGGLRPNAGSDVVVTHLREPGEDTHTPLQSDKILVSSAGVCAAGDDVELQDGDVVTVLGIGGYKDHVELVTVKGAVNHPGPIVLTSHNMRLSDAIAAAGGLRPEAFPQGVQFVRDPDLLMTAGQRGLAQIISRLNDLLNQTAYQREQAKSDLERIKAAGDASQPQSGSLLLPGGQAASSAPNPSSAILASQLAQRDLVSPPRVLGPDQLEPDGNVAVNLAEALKHPAGDDDILLVDGDTITVPEIPSTIQVVGAVVNARAVLYHPGAGLEFYVANSGGFAPDAATDSIIVIHAGGGLIPASKVRALQPGDVIVVPTRVMAEKLKSNSNGISSILSSVTSSAIAYRLITAVFGL